MGRSSTPEIMAARKPNEGELIRTQLYEEAESGIRKLIMLEWTSKAISK